MKTYQNIALALASTFLFTYCGNSTSAPLETAPPLTETAAPTVQEPTVPEEPAKNQPKQIESKPSGFMAICEEKEENNEESEDPIIITSCTYGDFKTVSTGTPDYKGRYSYDNSLYKLENGTYTEVPNTALFNQRKEELLKQVNEKIKADFLTFSTDPETKDCFEGSNPKVDFTMDELKIAFENDKLVFHVEFGLPDACRNVDGTSVSFPLREIEPYLNLK